MNRQVITTRGKPLQVAVPILRALSLLAVLGSALAGPVALASQSDESPAVSGVRVIDGDTLEIDGHTVQLYGIDAPEVGQHCERADGLWACGAEAALFLQK